MRTRKRQGGIATSTGSRSAPPSPLLFVVLPLLWMVSSSFKGPAGIGSSSVLPAQRLDDQLHLGVRAQRFGHYILNSVIVAVVSTVLVLFLATMAGYALGRLPMRAKVP